MSMQQLLKNLKAQYISELHFKIREIEEQLEKQGSNEFFYDAFHKLKGSGLTYGCGEISDVCGLVEGYCQSKHPRWPEAVDAGLDILKKVYIARLQQLDKAYDLGADPQYRLLVDLMTKSA